tara:strand:- start:832 stop:1386 length:555 start_codon:yes stop_codon:yes gene_type:complete
MKKTGRTLYLSGQVEDQDILVPRSAAAPTYSYGLASIWENERRGYGYIVRFVGAFPGVVNRYNNSYQLTTYSERDLRALNETVFGQNMALALIGAAGTTPPAENDRIIAAYSGDDVDRAPQRYDSGIIKHDALIVQSLSLAINNKEGSLTTYYIELEEYELTDDELVLALLSESSQNVANLEIV